VPLADEFERTGCLGPFDLLDARGVGVATLAHQHTDARFTPAQELARADEAMLRARPWFKSKHAHVPAFFQIASHPAIVGRVGELLGGDVMIWGCTTTVRVPTQRHRWHVDVEHIDWPGITVFLGLAGASPESSLTVMKSSHRTGWAPQDHGVETDEDALRLSRSVAPECELSTLEVTPGRFFILDGLLWHSSINRTAGTRIAVIAQYSRPDARVRIPVTWNRPVRWHSHRPPCIMAGGGSAASENWIVQPPRGESPIDYVPIDA